MSNKTGSEDAFFNDIRSILLEARKKSFRQINSTMVETYWQVGKKIVEQEQHGNKKAAYGDYLITSLSRVLGDEFGKGFSVANLWNFRKFYLTFQDSGKLYTLCRELNWSQVRLIMRVDDEKTREFYLREAKTQNWTVRQLERNIKSQYHQRLLSSRKLKQESSSLADVENTHAFIKDPYILEFLGLPENIKGKEGIFEQAIISNLQKFLLELGKGFSFVARQFRISTETTHFYIDLVFYNYILKCFIVIDLKTNKLSHQDIGQMDMYVRMFDDLKRGKDDNPTIGIILCADKDETVVKYSVLEENRQLFASRYKTVLPSEQELVDELNREKWMVKEKMAEYGVAGGDGV